MAYDQLPGYDETNVDYRVESARNEILEETQTYNPVQRSRKPSLWKSCLENWLDKKNSII